VVEAGMDCQCLTEGQEGPAVGMDWEGMGMEVVGQGKGIERGKMRD
jgi:hypothetical protein